MEAKECLERELEEVKSQLGEVSGQAELAREEASTLRYCTVLYCTVLYCLPSER